MSNIIHYLPVLIHACPVKIRKNILKYYSNDIKCKSKNHVSYNYIYAYYVGFMSICNGIIVQMPLDYLYYSQTVKVIGLMEHCHTSEVIEVMVLHKFGPIIMLLV